MSNTVVVSPRVPASGPDGLKRFDNIMSNGVTGGLGESGDIDFKNVSAPLSPSRAVFQGIFKGLKPVTVTEKKGNFLLGRTSREHLV